MKGENNRTIVGCESENNRWVNRTITYDYLAINHNQTIVTYPGYGVNELSIW